MRVAAPSRGQVITCDSGYDARAVNELLTDHLGRSRALAQGEPCSRERGMGIDETGSSNIGAIWAVRQGQQNRRGRGRNNNNRKNHNPLARSFESNGPDVKIRGTPAHIAEKYLTLARDAQTSGDPVLAENYLQHAEHYMRIIMAYREQLQQPGDMANGNGQRMREPGEGRRRVRRRRRATTCSTTAFAPQHQTPQQHQPPPRHSGGYDANRNDRPFRRDQGGFRSRDTGPRRSGPRRRSGSRDRDRDRGDRDRPMEGRRPPQERAPQPERHQEPAEAGHEPPPRREASHEPRRDREGEPRRERDGGGESRRRDRFQQAHEQPEFLRRPVRRARVETEDAAPPPAKDDPPSRD